MEVVEEIKDTGNNSLGALHVAAFSGKTKMCKFLIKDIHLNVNAAAQHGSSPLMCAICGSAPEKIVKLLLNHGADPDIANREGFTILHVLATKQGLLGSADILLSRGAHVDSMSEWGTPLHFASQCGHVEMMALLLNYKANPNRVVQLFYAPLTLALLASSLKCVELLIKAGADVNAGSPVTPLVVASMDGLTDCIKCLLEASAGPNIPDEIGRMPVEIAANHGWKGCVEILFPVTSRIARFTDWSVDGIMKSGHLHKSEEPALKAQGDAAFERKDYPHASALYTKAIEADSKDSTLYAKRITSLAHSLVDTWNGAFAPVPLSNSGIISEQDSEKDGDIVLHSSSSSLSTGLSRRRSFMRLCRKGGKIAQLLAYQAGVSASALGSNLQYLNDEFTDAQLFFKHMSTYKATGHDYAARAAGESAKVSKVVSKVLGGAGLTLGCGGAALSSVGFSLQKLHLEAQSGGSASHAVVEIVTMKSIEEAENVLKEWTFSQDIVIAEVSPQMDTDLAKKIMKLFMDAGALDLVKNSPILREKTERVLDDSSDWHLV